MRVAVGFRRRRAPASIPGGPTVTRDTSAIDSAGSPAAGCRCDSASSMSSPPRVSAVMPCLNEEASIAICIRKAQACFEELGIDGEIVVADNGSTDRSAQIARDLGARVICETRPGYGAALRAGILSARGEVIVIADSDDSYDWGELRNFVSKIDEGHDLVIGNRFAGGIEPGAMPPSHRYLGNPVLSMLGRIAFGVKITDFHCGMRAFTRSAFERMDPRSPGMEFATEMIANAARSGLRLAEIPVRLHRDRRDRPPHLRTMRDGWRHLRYIVSYAPDHLFMGPGALAFVVGIALQAVLATGPLKLPGIYVGIHFLILGGLLSVLGANVLLMGVLAKIAVAIRHPECMSPTTRRLIRRFPLEPTLAAGTLVFLAGFFVDAWILYRWLTHPGLSMESTVHPAGVATNAMVLGANVIFGAFLLYLLTSDAEIEGIERQSRSHSPRAEHAEDRGADVPGRQEDSGLSG
jgi:glycosyltransferase involved in cell wall biosynthesis